MVLHSGNPETQRGLQVAPSHTDRGLLSTAVLLLPGVSSGTSVLLHRGLLDAWAGGENLHQAQDTF